jgi:methionyl-tRNA formyltransferase
LSARVADQPSLDSNPPHPREGAQPDAQGMAEQARRHDRRPPLKVLIITQEDPFYLPHFFRAFGRRLGSNADRAVLEEVVVQPSFGQGRRALAKRLFGFYGGFDFLRLLLRYGKHQGLRLLERLGQLDQPVSIAGICRGYGVAVRVETDVNHPAFIERVRASGIDLIVSVAAPQIFGPILLETPPHGCINIHNGRLPDYRGMLPNFWQMLNGEPHSTTTIHTMVRRLDAGSVLWEEHTPIQPGVTLHELICATKAKSADALWRVLGGLAQDRQLTKIRDTTGPGTYYSFPDTRHAQRLRAIGHALL